MSHIMYVYIMYCMYICSKGRRVFTVAVAVVLLLKLFPSVSVARNLPPVEKHVCMCGSGIHDYPVLWRIET